MPSPPEPKIPDHPSPWVRFLPKINTRDPNSGTASWSTELEPRIAALIQAEHVSLLIGSGLTTAIGHAVGAQTQGMGRPKISAALSVSIRRAAERAAKRVGRGNANIEDDIRALRQLLDGLEVLGDDDGEIGDGASSELGAFLQQAAIHRQQVESELKGVLERFAAAILAAEHAIRGGLTPEAPDQAQRDRANRARELLGSFLLTFASRPASRERLHIFTANYDRLLEFACDLAGLHILDRFVGMVEPVFRSSRLGLDLHYNPPGIRGEPRYVEGVVRLTKLHGSLDWRFQDGPWGRPEVIRTALPFGASDNHPAIKGASSETIIIYPNPAKDIETLEYPYADLFRDFSAAVCRPNSVVVTYGYGFGDDHINRVLRDMLTIPSAHLLIVAYNDADGRIEAFDKMVGRPGQVSIMVGPEVAALDSLVDQYLPTPSADKRTWRLADLHERRDLSQSEERSSTGISGSQAGADR